MASADKRSSEVSLLDDLPLSSYQIAAILLTSATVILDGLDNQMLGLAAPSLLKEWGIAKSSLGYVFSLGFMGMGIGTLVAGWIGDRFGRRWALLAGVLLFGAATLACGFSSSITEIAIFKTIAGIGLGGVPGTAAAMIAEFSPRRWRSLAVTFGVVCVSLGGILGGLVATAILPTLGWRALFYVGGTATLLITALMLAFLPESPSFLLVRPSRRADLVAMLRRMGHPAPQPQTLQMRPATVPASVTPADPLTGALVRDTLALSATMLSGMFMIYLMFNWAPTMLASAGFGPASASLGLTIFNAGGTLGAIIAALVIMNVGSRVPLIIMATIGAAVCALLTLTPISGGRNISELLAGLCALGLFASAAQSAMFAVGTHVFPVAFRARGMGFMGAAGRVGALLSALLGATLIAAGHLGFFGALTGLMLVNAIGFAAIRAHIPRLARNQSLATVA